MYKKKFGQNFLINNKIAEEITSLANIKNQNVLEIGPGNLALSKIIIKKKPKKFVAIEIDDGLFNKSKSFFNENYSTIVNGNALEIEESNYFNNEPFIIISNLPFNISSKLLIKWLKLKSCNNNIKQMVLMFQNELANRIVASVNSRDYGRLSVITGAFFKTKKEIFVKKNDFFPKPKVDASVVVFEPLIKNKINERNFNKLEYITFHFFNSKRKKNKKKLLEIFSDQQIDKYDLKKLFDLRPQNIDPDTYYNMSATKT